MVVKSEITLHSFIQPGGGGQQVDVHEKNETQGSGFEQSEMYNSIG